MPFYQSIKDEYRDTRCGTWTVIGPSFSIRVDGKERDRVLVCQCDCGLVSVVSYHNIRTKKTKGCIRCRPKKVGDKCRRHGMSKTRIHNIWWGMITRCTNPNVACWENYGGRGIKVCERWKTFENFYEDMGEPPTDTHEIDRYPNKNGNYEPGNCRWATLTEQARNKRNVKQHEYRGQLLTAGQISELTGTEPRLINERLRRGWSIEAAAIAPEKKP